MPLTHLTPRTFDLLTGLAFLVIAALLLFFAFTDGPVGP